MPYHCFCNRLHGFHIFLCNVSMTLVVLTAQTSFFVTNLITLSVPTSLHKRPAAVRKTHTLRASRFLVTSQKLPYKLVNRIFMGSLLVSDCRASHDSKKPGKRQGNRENRSSQLSRYDPFLRSVLFTEKKTQQRT